MSLPVVFMISLNDCPIAVGLAPFDDFRHITVDLKHKLFPIAILHTTDSHILQGDDTLRHILRSVLEVIQTTVVEDKPAPFPTFPASSLHRKFVETFVVFSRSSVLCYTCLGASQEAITILMLPRRNSTSR